MISCRETSELLSRAMDEDLPWSRRLAVRAHLMLCAGCRRLAGQMRFLRAALRRYPAEIGARRAN